MHMGSWVDLGTTKVSHVANSAAISIRTPADNFRKLKIISRSSAFVITKLTITYNKGDTQIIENRFDIAKNGESQMIDIEGTGRTIKKIDFSVDSKDFVKGRAEATFFVRK